LLGTSHFVVRLFCEMRDAGSGSPRGMREQDERSRVSLLSLESMRQGLGICKELYIVRTN
jgi:3-methyladenine DNA glycosylase AlkC